jgi:hypothetical protein
VVLLFHENLGFEHIADGSRSRGSIAKILSHLERAAPEQYQSELPLGAGGPPVQSRLL